MSTATESAVLFPALSKSDTPLPSGPELTAWIIEQVKGIAGSPATPDGEPGRRLQLDALNFLAALASRLP